MSERLAKEIEEVFRNVRLGDGISLQQAQALDHLIAQFLTFIAESNDGDYDTLVAAMALETFWYQFLEPPAADRGSARLEK